MAHLATMDRGDGVDGHQVIQAKELSETEIQSKTNFRRFRSDHETDENCQNYIPHRANSSGIICWFAFRPIIKQRRKFSGMRCENGEWRITVLLHK